MRESTTPSVARTEPLATSGRSLEFTYRTARSGSLVAGLGIALLAETVVLHLWIAGHHPLVAWVLSASSLAALAWLVADHVAMGHGAICLHEDALHLDVGRRFSVRLPLGTVASATRPAWRDLPESGTPAAAGYLNLTAPSEPNVLLVLSEPTRVRTRSGISRTVRRLALHVDDPQRLVESLHRDA